jgi:hypothetical protein
MLTNVTFSLPERTVRRLRKRAAESGRRRGAISSLVDEAINGHLDSLEATARRPSFTATEGDRVVARAETLDALAAALRSKKVDPRSVRIVSSEPLEPVGRMGLRVRPS